MSLPAAQQRTLDSMDEALRASEPRLAAMFAMFTRLTKSEASPGSEQLPPRRSRRIRLPKISRKPARTSARSGLHEFWLHLLIASPLVIALLVVGLVVGLGSHAPPQGCSIVPGAHLTAPQHARSAGCPSQQGTSPGQSFVGKLASPAKGQDAQVRW